MAAAATNVVYVLRSRHCQILSVDTCMSDMKTSCAYCGARRQVRMGSVQLQVLRVKASLTVWL